MRRHWLLTMTPTALAVALLLSFAGRSEGQDREASPGIIGIDPIPVPDCGDADAPVTPCDIVINKELMITDLCVVEDPVRTKWTAVGADPNALGAWTFGKLMASIGGFPDVTTDPAGLSDFVRNWLGEWLVDQTQTSIDCISDARPAMQSFLIDRWEEVSHSRTLNMKLAPFRLLAIVNRIDLRRNTVYGAGNAGEARFVFGVLNINPADPNPDHWSQTQFTVILEYIQPASTCEEVKTWADRWHALGSIPFGATFNKELQKITDDFAGFNIAPGRPNGSSISQVRTNEIELGDPWELREFHLNPLLTVIPAPLEQTTVALTVDLRHNNTDLLADWMTQNEPDILAETHTIPLVFNGECFAAISSLNPPDTWRAPGFDCTETRHKFALNNCNGCHAPETDTRFLHVFPRDIGQESDLSRFLTGTNPINDVTCTPPGSVTRAFNDLKRRALDLCDLLMSECEIDIFRRTSSTGGPEIGQDGGESGPQRETPTNQDLFENAPHSPGNRVH